MPTLKVNIPESIGGGFISMKISNKKIEHLEPIQPVEFIKKQRARTRTLTEQSNEKHNQIVDKLIKEDEKIKTLKKKLERVRQESRMAFSKVEKALQKTMEHCDNNDQNLEILNKIKEEEKKIEDLKSQILQNSWAKYYKNYKTFAQKIETQKKELEEKKAQEQKNICEQELKKEEDIADNMEREIDRQSETLNKHIHAYNKACKSLNEKVSKERQNYVEWFRDFQVKKKELDDKLKALPKEETTISATSNNIFVTTPVKSAPNTNTSPASTAAASSNFTPPVPASYIPHADIPPKKQTAANNTSDAATIVRSTTKELVVV